ncbi:unnamed protein product [Rotaria sp. Silwood1]|nr:unnamed protein product [Rotaria sp. Silwood1]
MFRLSVILISIVSLTIGHICVWQPRQRGTLNIDMPDSGECYRKPSPCGGINGLEGGKRTKIQAGKAYTIEFQQNLNHYYTNNPGNMDISFAIGLNPEENDFQILKSINDYNPMNQLTQTNFSVDIRLPNVTCKQCVLRVRYVTNNPAENDHGTTFHQCSDIELTSKSIKENEKIVKQAEQRLLNEDKKANITKQQNSHDCCAPQSFLTFFVHHIPQIEFYSSGIIYYDKPSQYMRVSLIAGDGESNKAQNGKFDMWMNFTSGLQYYHNINDKKCYVLGLDYFNDWCFGNKYNQSEDFVAKNVKCKSHTGLCNQWKNGDFIFEAYANRTRSGCYPAGIYRLSTGERTDYYYSLDGPFSPEIFQPDELCLKNGIPSK